jgi:phosphatidylglycerol:prolipoprotein diacylglycerol transferase
VGDPLDPFDRLTLVAAAIAGAGIGSKLLVWLQHPDLLRQVETRDLLSGKSVAGALLGGLVLVECVKRWIGVRQPTGDLYVLPLCLGVALGRVGCFLSGLDDHTYGAVTSLPWGVDFGDGVRRHPTQLYEIAFLIPIAIWAARRMRAGVMDGSIFRGFLASYLAFRVALDFVKPEPRPYLGLTGTQVAGLIGIAYLVWIAYRLRSPRTPITCEPAVASLTEATRGG